MAAIPCNQIELEALRLQNLFKSCYKLKAQDLDDLANLAYSASLCGEGGAGSILQNNIFITMDSTSGQIPTANGLGPAATLNALPQFEIDEKEIREFKHHRIVELDNYRTILETSRYIIKPGKGIYGLLGTAIDDTDLLLVYRTSLELGTPGNTTNTPIVYNLFTSTAIGSTVSTPHTVLNASTTVITIDSTRDVYFHVFDDTNNSGNSKIYRFIGTNGTYGDAGAQVASSGDFILVESFSNSPLEIPAIKVKVRELMVSAIIRPATPVSNISEAVIASFPTSLSCTENELLIFVVQKENPYSTGSPTLSLITEKWIWKKGKTSDIPLVCTVNDFAKIEEVTTTTIAPSSPGQIPRTEVLINEDLDAPDDALNASVTPIVVVATDDLYIKLVSTISDRIDPEYKIYKFTGGAGTYGDGETPVVLGDFDAFTVYSDEVITPINSSNAVDVYFEPTVDITSDNVQDAIEEVYTAIGAVPTGSAFAEITTGDPLLDITTAGYRTGKTGFGLDITPEELVDIEGTQTGATGAVKTDYTWTAGQISRVQLGGQNIMSELGVPSGVVKGNVSDYLGAGSRAGLRAYVINGDFGTLNPALGDFAFSSGVTNLAGTNFANFNAYPQPTGWAANIRTQNATSDVASVNVRQYGLAIPYNLEPEIHIVNQNSEADDTYIRLTPHYIEHGSLQKLTNYGSGTFITGYIHTDTPAKTGTAATTLGAASYSLGVDANGNILEMALSPTLTLEAYEESGTRVGGDLILTLGDYDTSNNGTYILIDDAAGTITMPNILDANIVAGGNQAVATAGFVFSQTGGFIAQSLTTGDWDMTSFFGILVPHGLSATEWKTARVSSITIRNDADDLYVEGSSLIRAEIDATNIGLYRIAADIFDTVDYDTAAAYNRGWIEFKYISD